MDMKGCLVNGGVIITHQVREGKHHYEVDKVMKYKKESGGKMFVRKGDKLMEINGVELHKLTPEEVAQKISEGSPMLTVHKSEKKMEQVNNLLPDKDILQPYSKESTILSFSWELTREEETGEENEVCAGRDACKDKNNMKERDLLFIQMTKTSISVVSGRGCEAGSHCEECNGTRCTFKDFVVVSESSMVTLVPRGGVSFRQEKLAHVLIRHVPSHQYIRAMCSGDQKSLYSSPNPERITIYYYKSSGVDMLFRGMPVVLNITDSNFYLRCYKDGTKVFLQVETYEKQKLRQISISDECTFSFVFYMKADRTKQRRFESALFNGWFIHLDDSDTVDMGELDGGGDPSFLFVIQK